MKACTKCHKIKPLFEFFKNSTKKDGVNSSCKDCHITYKREWNRSSKGKASNKRYKASEAGRVSDKKYYSKNKEKIKLWVSEYKEQNKSKVVFHNATRHSRKLNATPAWANMFFIEEIYDLAERRTESLGIRCVVDHIIPLQGKDVCGLHVENNLQVITYKENAAKGNSFII